MAIKVGDRLPAATVLIALWMLANAVRPKVRPSLPRRHPATRAASVVVAARAAAAASFPARRAVAAAERAARVVWPMSNGRESNHAA